jgi:hypothetical protein
MLPDRRASSSGGLRDSMVRYAMQRRGSSTNGAGNAAVGQASRQRVHDPQRSASGVPGGSSSVVTTSPRSW